MRQRLLLVAGWAAAAVVASLVSTGAVAVAGGQVTDRPLRPLSASEVAALTEECGLSDRAPCLRQLDNSEGPPATVVAAPTTNSSPEGDEQGVSPLLPDEIPDTPSEDPLDPAVEVDESLLVPEETDAPEPRAEVLELIGGRVSISGADGDVTVIWVIPSHGFALLPPTGVEVEEGTVTLIFSDGSHRSIVVARWSDEEGLILEPSEGGLDLTVN